MKSLRSNKICVIIPMHNFGELTKKCIDLTLENAGIGVDIIVIDDASKEPFFDNRASVIRLDENVGFTKAVNIGIEKAWNDYEYIHLLNNDTEPYKDFVKELIVAFKQDHAVGVAGSVRITIQEGKEAIFSYPLDCVSGYSAYTWEDLPDDYCFCPWIPFCSVMIKSEVLKQVGLLDHRMKNHCSDNDFCVRTWVMGYHVTLAMKSKVFHHHETTTRSLNLNATDDQQILLTKVRCDFIRGMLEAYPLDGDSKKMYELIFREKE